MSSLKLLHNEKQKIRGENSLVQKKKKAFDGYFDPSKKKTNEAKDDNISIRLSRLQEKPQLLIDLNHFRLTFSIPFPFLTSISAIII